MDDLTTTNDSEFRVQQASAFDNGSESFDHVRTEDWQRLTPQYRYRLDMREEKSEDIFFGGQMCE
jgi:hypothetical protein